jgi:hypothetical protein
MSKRSTQPAAIKDAEGTNEAKPKESKKREAGLNGAGPFIPASYEAPRHFSRVVAARGGPWTESVVAAVAADAELSKVLQSGYDILMARTRGVVTDGIFMTWLFAKPKGHEGQGFREIRHIIRTIRGNMGAIPPALTTQDADALLDGLLSDGYRLFNTEVVTVDMNGQSVMWVLVR